MAIIIFDQKTRRGKHGAFIRVSATEDSLGPEYTAVNFSTPGHIKYNTEPTLKELKKIIDDSLVLGAECQKLIDRWVKSEKLATKPKSVQGFRRSLKDY